MKVLVTGANGLIGANLTRQLIYAGYQVRALVRPTSDMRSLHGVDVETVYGDVLDAGSLPEAVQGCDIVFHTAAMFSYWQMNAAELENLAIEGTRNVITVAGKSGVSRMVLTSSSVVLGSSDRPLVRNEEHQLGANDTAAYIISKALQEQYAFGHAEDAGIELISVCPTMTVGPHGYRLGPSNGIIVSYLNDASRATFPGGCNIVSADDVARGHILAAETGVPGQHYVLGSENLSWFEIHKIISELCGIAGPYWKTNHTISYLAAAMDEITAKLSGEIPLTTRTQARMVGRYYWYDHGKAAALGYQPKSTRRALAEAISWLAASPHVSRKVRISLQLSREVYQVRKNLTATGATIEAIQ